MGLSWQQGPLGRDPNGTFLTATVISHGPDRNLSVDEIGGIQLVEDASAAQV